MGKDMLTRFRHPDALIDGPKTVDHKNFLITSRAPISLTDLSAGNLPYRYDMGGAVSSYKNLGTKPFDILAVTNKTSGQKQYVLVGPALDSEEVNFVLYAAAPNKANGYNTEDIIMDYNYLMHGEGPNSVRRKLHNNIPGWDDYEKNGGGADIADTLVDHLRNTPGNKLVPVVRWTVDNGIPRIILEPLDPELAEGIAKALPHKISESSKINNILGLPFVAAYSPNIKVARYAGYNPTKLIGDIQEMGPGQMIPYFFLKLAQSRIPGMEVPPEMDIQQSHLFAAASTYADTGSLPPATKEKQPKPKVETIIRDYVWSQFDGIDLTTNSNHSLPGGGSVRVRVNSETNERYFNKYSGGLYFDIEESTTQVRGKEVKTVKYEVHGRRSRDRHITVTLIDTPKRSKIEIYKESRRILIPLLDKRALADIGIALP